MFWFIFYHNNKSVNIEEKINWFVKCEYLFTLVDQLQTLAYVFQMYSKLSMLNILNSLICRTTDFGYKVDPDIV